MGPKNEKPREYSDLTGATAVPALIRSLVVSTPAPARNLTFPGRVARFIILAGLEEEMMAKKEKKEKKPAATESPAAPAKLTPVDIRRATFGSALGGFKKAEVQAFLERVAKSMEEVLRDKRTLEEQMGELRAQLMLVDELRAERDKMDEQMFLLTGEIEAYKKELEKLRAGGAGSPELDALRQENEILRQECESLRAQIEMAHAGGDPGEAEALMAEIRNLKAQLEEARSVAAGPAEMISLAKNVAEQIKTKAREDARQTLLNAMKRMEELLEELA